MRLKIEKNHSYFLNHPRFQSLGWKPLVVFTWKFNSIQFILYRPISQMYTFCTHTLHPWPLTSHRIRKNSQEIEKTLSGGIKVRTLQESNRGGSLSRMDRRIDVMWPEGIVTELQHIQWVRQSGWIVHRRHGPLVDSPFPIIDKNKHFLWTYIDANEVAFSLNTGPFEKTLPYYSLRRENIRQKNLNEPLSTKALVTRSVTMLRLRISLILVHIYSRIHIGFVIVGTHRYKALLCLKDPPPADGENCVVMLHKLCPVKSGSYQLGVSKVSSLHNTCAK